MKHYPTIAPAKSPLVEMLDSLAAQPQPAPVEYVAHEVDSEGFPLCRCDACREKSKTRNAIEFGRMFGGLAERKPIECSDDRDAYNVYGEHHQSRGGE